MTKQLDNSEGVVPLLPCPFCARAPVLRQVAFIPAEAIANGIADYWWIGCEIDANITGCGIGHANIDKAVAIRTWNTRAYNPEPAEKNSVDAALREIARLTNLYLGGGCCELHHQANLKELHRRLRQFEDDSFTSLRTESELGNSAETDATVSPVASQIKSPYALPNRSERITEFSLICNSCDETLIAGAPGNATGQRYFTYMATEAASNHLRNNQHD